MASAGGASASEKPILVRVKRKPSQTRPDAFWLEINERPVKKAMLDFSSLSVSEPSSNPKALEEPLVKKLLVQHIETVHHSEAVQDVLHSLLHTDSDAKEVKSKMKEWNNRTKQDKKQDQLRSAARQRHEDLGRNARFAQIWRRRKGDRNEVDESLREICHLYDAVQVDSDEEKHAAESRQINTVEGQERREEQEHMHQKCTPPPRPEVENRHYIDELAQQISGCWPANAKEETWPNQGALIFL
uniref:Uncharacterized protein n=1 Tax=Leersia perrieri TaxID=77586 RepID=A0A0D9XNB1_9ORYZ